MLSILQHVPFSGWNPATSATVNVKQLIGTLTQMDHFQADMRLSGIDRTNMGLNNA